VQSGLERRNSISRLFAEVSETDGCAPTDIVGVVSQGLDQCWDDLSGVSFSLRQKASRNDTILLLMRLEVADQFFGSLFLLAATCEQANEEN
jgi:hypothetical protein